MRIELKSCNHNVLVSPDDCLTWQSCEQLRETLVPYMVEETESIYLDLRKVFLIDSVAIGNLMRMKMACQGLKINLILLCANKEIHQTMQMVKLDNVFDFRDEQETEKIITLQFSD